jgi:hypothetical protein
MFFLLLNLRCFNNQLVPEGRLLSAAKGYYHAADLEGAKLTWADNKTLLQIYKLPVVLCVMARLFHNGLVNDQGVVPKRQWIKFQCLRPIDKDVLDILAFNMQQPPKGEQIFCVICTSYTSCHPIHRPGPSKDLLCRPLVKQVCYEECMPFHTVSLLYIDTGIQIVPFKDIYDARDVVDRKYKLDASYLEANDVIFLEFIVRRCYLDRNVKTSWGVTFDLMAIFRMLTAPDNAPVEPDSGDERSAI